MNYKVRFSVPCFILVLIMTCNIIAQQITSETHPGKVISDQLIPKSFDNLEGLPPVGDQVVGGSCYAWAAAYYYLTHLQWKEYGWNVNDPEHQCSPAFVYNLTNGGVDNGAWEGDSARHDAFELFETLGCATMADMPYSYTAYQTFPGEAAFRNGMQFRTLSTHYIETRNDSGLQILKEHLLSGDLAVLGIYGYQNLVLINNYNNIYCVSQVTGGRLFWHDVTIIGYDDSLVTADGTGAFHLVNSWGTGWGENGFFWMSYEAVKHVQTSYGYVMYAADRNNYEPDITARLEVQHTDRYHLVYQAGIGSSSSTDTLLTFFDFSPMSLQAGVPYPGSAFVLDLSDIKPFINPDGENEIFIRVIDEGSGNGLSGTVNSLIIEDLSQELSANTPGSPVAISDDYLGAEIIINLDYSYQPPQNINSEVESQSGLVQLSWDPPTEPGGLVEYHIFLNGRLIATTQNLMYEHFLSLRGVQYYGVSAVFTNGESLSARTSVSWPGPDAFGIPFTDNYENGFSGWYQIGSSGIPSIMSSDYIYEGQHSVGIKTFPADNTALARFFESTEGADVETWFLINTFPVSSGGGGCVLFSQDNKIFGSFFDSLGHPGYVYTNSQNQLISTLLDTAVTINPDTWYKQKIWYCDGKLQIMILDDNWNVILNRAVNFTDQNINIVGLYAEGLNGGWNYFDKFSIKPWMPDNLAHFDPVYPTDSPYAIIINEAVVDSSLLVEGDEIAIYDGNVCVGAVIVDTEWPLEMNVWEADSINPGFTNGHMITAHIWSAQTNTEYMTDLTFDVGNGNFGSGNFSRVSIEGTTIVSVSGNANSMPGKYLLFQNYPNPFNPSTTIKYQIADYSFVTIRVYDILGEEITTLINDWKPAGNYKISFDANNLSSGIYIYQLRAGSYSETKKMLLVK
jgi:C1A family cysteine protease